MCDYIPDFCPADEYYTDDLDEDPYDEQWPSAPDYDEEPGGSLVRASLVAWENDTSLVERQGKPKPRPKKGTSGRRPYYVEAILGAVLELYARRYPGPSSLFSGQNGRQANRIAFRLAASPPHSLTFCQFLLDADMARN